MIAAVAGLSAGVSWAQVEPIRPPGDSAAKVEPGDETEKREPMPAPKLSPSVKALMDQPYLTDDEKRALRVKHGLWEEADLADAASKAAAVLACGDFFNGVFDDASVKAEDRAEAFWKRGEPEKALGVLKNAASIRAARLRAESLTDLGRVPEAVVELETLTKRTMDPALADADELVEGVRGMILWARLAGSSKAGNEFQHMIRLLAHAREDLDRLSWRANLAEAELLGDKNNYGEMGEAITTTLSLNPRCAQAWLLAGEVAADTFDFERAESIALRLDVLAEPEVSPYAAIVRAKVQLKQSEGDKAEAALRGALAKYPHQRGLMAAWAAAAAGRFNFDEAKKRLDAFDAVSPGSPIAYMETGKAMASSRQYAEAAEYLREAAKRAPMWPEPVIELGLSELQAGRDVEALAALEKAAEIDSFNVRAANSLTLLKELATYTSTQSEHFIVRCKPGVDEVLAAEMLPQLEKIYDRVTGNGPGGIDHKPAHKTTVEVYPNHRWFGVRITGMPQLHTIAAATGPVIAMEAPMDGPGHMGAYNWARVVQHEYTHTVTLSRTKNRLPHWFTEASAVYLEDAPRDTSTVELLARAFRTDTLFDFDTINVMFARPKKPSDRMQAYMQGAWMYEFIIERYGMTKPLELMDLYAKGVREEAAFVQVLGVGREEFTKQFKVYARDQLIGWGMYPTPGTPDIQQLLAMENGATPSPEDAGPGSEGEAAPLLVEKWLEKYPSDPFVLAAAVKNRVTAQEGKAKPADIELIERYAAARPMDVFPHKLLAALFLSGAAESVGKGPAAAIEHLEYLDDREQHSSGYAVELSRQYAAMGDLEKAAVKAERATQISPYSAVTREHAATIALRRKDYPTAERHLKALVALEPDRAVHQQRLDALEKLKAAR